MAYGGVGMSPLRRVQRLSERNVCVNTCPRSRSNCVGPDHFIVEMKVWVQFERCSFTVQCIAVLTVIEKYEVDFGVIGELCNAHHSANVCVRLKVE